MRIGDLTTYTQLASVIKPTVKLLCKMQFLTRFFKFLIKSKRVSIKRKDMKEETLIDKFIDKVDRDGKNGKDLTLAYVISILEEILENS